MPDVEVTQPIPDSSGESKVNSDDVKQVAFANHTAAMTSMTNGLAISTDLLNKVAIKKYDEVEVLEAKGTQMVGWTPPIQGQPTGA